MSYYLRSVFDGICILCFHQSLNHGDCVFAAGDCANIKYDATTTSDRTRAHDIRSAFSAQHQGHLCAQNVALFLQSKRNLVAVASGSPASLHQPLCDVAARTTVGTEPNTPLKQFPGDEFGCDHAPVMVIVSLGIRIISIVENAFVE